MNNDLQKMGYKTNSVEWWPVRAKMTDLSNKNEDQTIGGCRKSCANLKQ